MLSVGRIGSGDGNRYLTDQVVSHDTPRAGERLVSYYERTGMPQGQWAGRQAVARSAWWGRRLRSRRSACSADALTRAQASGWVAGWPSSAPLANGSPIG